MLAERLPGVLPDLRLDEALEVTSVHSVAGTLAPGAPLVTRPPYQAPHHTASVAAIVGGGSSVLRPGAASLAQPSDLYVDT
jgi:magnesium chelatase family protein